MGTGVPHARHPLHRRNPVGSLETTTTERNPSWFSVCFWNHTDLLGNARRTIHLPITAFDDFGGISVFDQLRNHCLLGTTIRRGAIFFLMDLTATSQLATGFLRTPSRSCSYSRATQLGSDSTIHRSVSASQHLVPGWSFADRNTNWLTKSR